MSSDKTNKKFNILSQKEKILLIDGYYSFIHFYNNNSYIPIDLCHIIIKYFKNNFIFDFIIVFEKQFKHGMNGLLMYDINSKNKMIINNDVWEYNFYTSYCVHETNDDCFIYRVGGQDNYKIPNIKYSIVNNTFNQ